MSLLAAISHVSSTPQELWYLALNMTFYFDSHARKRCVGTCLTRRWTSLAMRVESSVDCGGVAPVRPCETRRAFVRSASRTVTFNTVDA